MKYLFYKLLLRIIYELYIEKENGYQRVLMLLDIISEILF